MTKTQTPQISSNPIPIRSARGSRVSRWMQVLLAGSVSAMFGMNSTVQAAPTRSDWCSTLWSTDNAGTTSNGITWIAPSTGATSATASGATANLNIPPFFPGTGSVAGIGIHTESGTMFAFDRAGTTGTLYKYKFGTDTTWQSVSVTGLVGTSGTQTIAGASNNLNKVTVVGNTLIIAESNGIAVYTIPLNSSGTVTGNATATKYSFAGDPGAYLHRSTTNADPAGTSVINGGDLATDEYGDVYNITYNVNVTGYSGTGQQLTTTTKAYFYKQNGTVWQYQGETAATASFAGAAFYRGELYVKAATQLKKVPLTRSGSGYTGWSSTLSNVGAATSSYSSADLAACGTPITTVTKTQQVYTDSSATALAADQANVKSGGYVKYTITAKNTGTSWARSSTISDNLPAGTVYVANSAVLNGTNLGLGSYPGAGFTVESIGGPSGVIKYAPDPDTATLSFVVQVTATSGTVKNQATIAYVDSSGLASEAPNCTSVPTVNCGVTSSTPVLAVISGQVWDDGDASITINSEPGTNAGGLTVYAVDSNGKVAAKATVDSTTGLYSLGVLSNAAYTLRLSTNSSFAVGATAPATPSLPTGWVNTGENKNGTTETTTPGEIAIPTVTANVSGQHFGIEQLPTATGTTAPSQTNPGGSSTQAVPASAFGGTDPDGLISSYTIKSFPSNATSIVINGTTHTSATFPIIGVSVTANPDGSLPAGAVRVDPVDGAVTVGIPFTVTDNAGKTSSAASTANIPFTPLSLSGRVWADVDGSANGTFTNIFTNVETGTNAGGLNAVLVDTNGKVIASLPVNPDGTYSFSNIPSNTDLKLVLSTTAGAVGQPAPTPSVPVGWINTSPLETPIFNTGTVSQAKDFGVERLPTATGSAVAPQPNPTGTASVPVPPSAFGGNDSDGTITKYTISAFPNNAETVTINGTTYTPGSFPNGGVIVTANPDGSFPTGAVSVNPLDGAVTVGIPFTVTDNAGKTSTPATVSVPFAPITISGTVWDDKNGNTVQDGVEPVTNAGGLFAVLTDNAGTVLEVVPVAVDGTYSFAQVAPNTDLKVLVTTANPALGSTVTSALLPTGWTNTTPSSLAFNTGSSSVTGKNFGLDQQPETDNKTVPNQLNPTGNTQFTVPTLTGLDTEDGALGSGKTFKITALPTNGTLYYDGVAVLLDQKITNYDPAKLKVDPDDGITSLSFQVAAVDAAGQPDPSPATVTMGFTPVAPPVANDNAAQSLPNLIAGDSNFVIINILGNDSAATGATLVPGTVDLDPATPGQQTSFSNAQGSFVLQPDNTVKFTPALGVSGVTVTIPYTVQDNFGQTSNPANLSVEINIPAANPDSTIAPFNTPVTFGASGVPAIAANDITITGRTIEPSTIDLDPGMAGQQTIFSVMGKGTFVLEPASGNVTFTPETGFFGTVSIPYTIQDSAGLRDSSPANITVTLNPPAPDARDDSSSTTVNAPKVIDVLLNDVGPGINPTSVTVPTSGVGAPTKGVVTIAPDGKITYTPTPGVSGLETFAYTVCNTAVPAPVCDTATVTINITPQAAPDTATTPSGSSVNFPVAANDIGSIDPATIDLDPSTPAIDPSLTVPGKGIFTTQPDGTVTFAPEAGFSGPVTPISYTVQDTSGLISNPATITVTVTPKATNDTAITEVGLPVKTSVLANDKGSLDPTTVTVTVNPAHGTITVNPDGTITYTPAPGYSGADIYTYRVCDTSGQCTTATVSVNVGVVAKPDTDTTKLGTPVTTTVLANDLGNLNSGNVTVPGNPSNGSVVVNPDGTITYTPAPGFSGTDAYTYRVCDANDANNCSSTTVTITVAPVAVDDAASTPAGTPVTFAVVGNDLGGVDPASIDLDPATPGRQDSLIVANQGTFTANADGTVTFAPVPGFSGPVNTVPYTLKTPGGIESAAANLSVNVTPLAGNDVISTPANQSIDIPALGNDKGTIDPSSLDLDPITPGIQPSLTVPEGVFSLNPDHTVKFTPNPGFVGLVAPITYAIKDTSAQITTATINVSVGIAAPPVASADPATTPAGVPVTFKLLLNDAPGTYPIDPTKIDLDPSTPAIDPSYTVTGQGTFTANPDGTVTFTPVPGFSGPVTPTPYTIADQYNNTSAPVNISVTVTPKATNDTASTPAGTSIKVAVSINDLGRLDLTSIDLDPNTTGIQTTLTVAGQGVFLANPDGTVTFTPADGFSGPVTPVPYTMADTSAQRTPSALITVTVTPKPLNDDAATYTNNPVNIAVLTNDKGNLDPATLDLDLAVPGIQTSATTPSGTVSLNPDQTVKYTPNTGFDGTDSFTYQVCDQAGQCADATVTVTVSPNLPPVAQDRAESEVNSNATLKLTPLLATDADGTIKSYTVSSLPTPAMGVLYLGDPASGGALVAVGQTLTPAQAADLYFKPASGFFGPASFKFTATDDKGAVDATPAKVTIPVNAPPVARLDNATTTLGTPVTIPVLANDTDADGALVLGSIDLDPSTPAIDPSFTVPGKGTFTANPDGTVTFAPEPGFSGSVTTPYTVNDNRSATSNPAEITVIVKAGTVTGYVYSDLNNDGVQQPNEPDLANVPVVITDSLGHTTTVTTDANGNYQALVVPGATTANVTDPANTRLTTGNNPQTLTVTDGGTTETTPVGFQPLEGSVAGRVFEDKNGNGKFDDGEGLLGVTVRITDPVKKDNSGNPVVYTVQTDANGTYTQMGVSVGDAMVDVDDATLPAAKPGEANWVQTVGTDPSTVSVQPNATNDAGDDGYNRPKITLLKEALSTVATVGGTVDWRVTITNAGLTDLREITITDTLPKGLVYKKGTSLIVGGAKIADPTVDPQNPRSLVWKLSGSLLKSGQKLAIAFTTTVTPEAQPGKLENTAGASAQTGATTSTVTARAANAVAAVKIELGVFTNKSVILGRVYFDMNDNNSFDSDADKPLEGARIYMSDGRFAVTDAQGRYSLPDVEPGLHALRLDPLTAPYTPKAVPDDQGQRGSRYARTTEFGGIVTKDFLLVAPNGALTKNRSTTVTRGPVKLEKTVFAHETAPDGLFALQQGGAGYAIQTVFSLSEAVANLTITDPLPKDATRGTLSLVSSDGRTIPVEVSKDGQTIRIPGVLEQGTYTLTYAMVSSLPPELIVTDPSISYEEVIR
jgi:fimbrial isopeptide formation D2 family protein/uncharacterized repeat protein (TIGR01451 family)